MCCYGDFPTKDTGIHPCAHFSSTGRKGLSVWLPNVPAENSQPQGGSPLALVDAKQNALSDLHELQQKNSLSI